MKEFTEDEKMIAKNINDKYKWIARDKNRGLCVYTEKPKKLRAVWYAPELDRIATFYPFNHMFSSIKWQDDGPTRISDIYNPQILDETEHKYLKVILKPFHEKVVYVAKLRAPSASGKDGCSKEYLFIAFYSGGFSFPDFDPGKMYSGMELGKKYKLGELGITYKDGENK